jgi:hypothetical protein
MNLRDVGMIEGSQHLRFALEAGEMIGVPSHRLGKRFDGDIAIQLGIERPIHLAHPPSTDPGKDFVGTVASA